MFLLYPYRYAVFFGLFALHVALFWPGYLNPDSANQYAQAIAGIYDDHHPAMMSFVWRYLAMIYPGPAMMYLWQLLLFYGALFFIWQGARVFIDFKKSPWILLLIFLVPWLPQTILYSVTIQKDNAFAFSFLTVGAILAYFTVKNRKIGGGIVFFLMILMIYGIGVKYQAQFCAPVLIVWMGFLWANLKPLWTRVGAVILISVTVYGAVFVMNAALVPHARQSNAWQYVKLFDLAAISRAINQDLIPIHNKTPSYDFNKLRDRFQENAVDSYIYTNDNIFQKTSNPGHMDYLRRTWMSAVWDHPLIYLTHRFRNLAHCLMGRVGFTHYDDVAGRVIDTASPIYPIVKTIIGGIGYVVLSQFPIILLGLAYFGAGVFYWRRSACARVMVGFTSIAFIMLGILLFMSMAGTPRYTYVSVLMIHGCHVFAVGLYREWGLRGKNDACLKKCLDGGMDKR